MDTFIKLQDIATQMHLEPAEDVPLHSKQGTSTVAPCGQVVVSKRRQNKKADLGIYQAVMPNGKKAPLLKTLLTSACERDCHYCPFRAGRNYQRTTFKPQEMAQAFMDMYRAGVAKGLFLSSGIIGGGVRTQDKLIETAVLLRQKHQFQGFIHLKVMPGAEQAQIERAMQLVDRLSVNLEAPNEKRLLTMAPRKQFFKELVQPLQWIEEIRQSQPAYKGWNGRWPSTTTQFVVGGTDETDLELLATAQYLTKTLHLGRTYFSTFSPIIDTPLENRPAENPIRTHRLYQASFLFRDYDFNLEEMPFTSAGNLPLDADPKLAWAKANLHDSPVEVNQASRNELLRVPGVGPKGATAIVMARSQSTLRHLQDLQAIGVQTKRLVPFVLLDGKRPLRQLRLL